MRVNDTSQKKHPQKTQKMHRAKHKAVSTAPSGRPGMGEKPAKCPEAAHPRAQEEPGLQASQGEVQMRRVARRKAHKTKGSRLPAENPTKPGLAHSRGGHHKGGMERSMGGG